MGANNNKYSIKQHRGFVNIGLWRKLEKKYKLFRLQKISPPI